MISSRYHSRNLCRLVDFLLHAVSPNSGGLQSGSAKYFLWARLQITKPNWGALTNFSNASRFGRHHVQIANIIRNSQAKLFANKSANIYSQCVLVANKFANIRIRNSPN
jgi:hypothetical protein